MYLTKELIYYYIAKDPDFEIRGYFELTVFKIQKRELNTNIVIDVTYMIDTNNDHNTSRVLKVNIKVLSKKLYRIPGIEMVLQLR